MAGEINEPFKPFVQYEATQGELGVIYLSGKAADGSRSGDLVAIMNGHLPFYVGREPKGFEIASAVRRMRRAQRAQTETTI